MKKIFFYLFICAFSFDLTAFIPPSSYIIEQMARKCALYPKEYSLSGAMEDENRNYFQLGFTRSYDYFSWKKTSTHGELESHNIELYFFQNFLACRGKNQTERKENLTLALASLGIDEKKLSFYIRPQSYESVYVIGQNFGEEGMPQVQVSIHSFLPFFESHKGAHLSFTHYLPISKNAYFPAIININGKTLSLAVKTSKE